MQAASTSGRFSMASVEYTDSDSDAERNVRPAAAAASLLLPHRGCLH